MVQFYPLLSDIPGNSPTNSVLRPWLSVKQIEHEILSRHKDMNLIAEVFLEWDAAPDQARATLPSHPVPRSMIGLMAEMVPDTQADRPLVLLSTLTDSPAPFGHMLNRGVNIQEPHEQAGQATTVRDYILHALPLILERSRCFTDQWERTRE
jgi:hypothetical protein